MVYENPKWTTGDFDFDRDVAYVEDKMGPIVNATNPDLSAFRDRGGRLIIYHGWGDAAIPAQSAIDYYNSVVNKMGAEEAQSFVRLFLAPGVQHCSGGPGPNSFGEYPGPAGDAANDVVKALERWVEEGVAPEKILATKYHKDGDRNSGVVRSRPLCSHPQAAQYRGNGSADDAASFSCGE
jgi:feruloyl esterase